MDYLGAFCSRNPGKRRLSAGERFSAAIANGGALYDLDPLALDDSGNGHFLTLINAPTQDAGDGRPLGSMNLVAASLQGATALDAVDLRTDAANGLTVFAWVKRSGGGAVFRVVGKGNVSTPGTFEWQLNYNNASRMAWNVGNGVAFFTVTDNQVTITDATWFFVAAQIIPAAKILRISVNRQTWVTALYTGDALATTNLLRIGFDTTGRYWNGNLDGIGILPTVLEDDVLDLIYNNGAGQLLGNLV